MTLNRLYCWGVTLISLVAVIGCTHRPEQTLTLDLSLDQLSGNITAEQRTVLLQSPDARVEASYWPNFRIPGINAHVSKCGLLMLPCVEADDEDMVIHSTRLDASNGRISFDVPLRSSKRRFPLQYMRIVLPFDELADAVPTEQNYEFDLYPVKSEDVRHVMPVWLPSSFRALAGTLILKGEGAFGPNTLPSNLASASWDPPYLFYPRNRFAAYGDVGTAPFPVLQTLRPPYPQELDGMEEIYSAEISGGPVDGHWLERVRVSAKRKKDETCFVSDLGYDILWVDGTLIRYSEENSDPRDGQCQGWYRKVDFDNAGKVIAFDRSVVDGLNMGTHVTYLSWNSTCAAAPQQPAGNCTITSPSTDQVAGLLETAGHVRQWFQPSKVLQQKENRKHTANPS
jgi:hypothetical protein